MKKIAFIVTKSEIGGAQTWTNEMMKLVKNEGSVYLITSEDGWLTEQGNFDKVLILPQLKKHFSLSGYISLLKYIRKENINVMVASSANAGIYSRMARLISKFKCIYVSHGWSCIYNGGKLKSIFIKIEKYLSYITDIIWCVSISDEEKATRIIGINKRKIRTLTNAVIKMKEKEGNDCQKKIIFVGRLTYPKRPDLLINVVAKHPDMKLDIVGGGEYFYSLQENSKTVSNINFVGEVQGFNNYSDYDLFVLVSDSEGLPMSGLEAHTAGIPLVLSNVGGCSELIAGNGLLVDNTEQDVERGIISIFDNYDDYLRNSREVKGKFVFDSYADEYKKLILD
ncbi:MULTISPECIES: glycosyltransferase [Citrobacter]|uniref:glycosyltransferase n=1 Tax=Citrobacter TaxID=544 RepID=UPI001249B027|nr:glycosyltransferase [Citrobacter sp. Cu096]MDM2741776.1 glycosyltransferase [Citrobacter sp. Cu096]